MIALDPAAGTAAAALATLADLARFEAPEVATWAAQAARRLAAGLDPARALGIDGASLGRARLRERNQHLRAAWAAVSPDVDLPNRQRALLLLQAAHRFETTLWPRIRDRDAPPPGLSPVQLHLFGALRAGGGKLPAYRRILDLCNSGPV
jgi:hypothetical protein